MLSGYNAGGGASSAKTSINVNFTKTATIASGVPQKGLIVPNGTFNRMTRQEQEDYLKEMWQFREGIMQAEWENNLNPEEKEVLKTYQKRSEQYSQTKLILERIIPGLGGVITRISHFVVNQYRGNEGCNPTATYKSEAETRRCVEVGSTKFYKDPQGEYAGGCTRIPKHIICAESKKLENSR